MTRITLLLVLLSMLSGWGGAVIEKAGVEPDPNRAPTATGDEGCEVDPNGRPRCVPGN